jgi:hypothetical protein
LDDGGNKPYREGDGVNEHFEVHHEAAGVLGSEDVWRSRRSNSRYSQESDDSDVTPRASRGKQRKEANAGNDRQGDQNSDVRDLEGESPVVLEGTVTNREERPALVETWRPNIGWEAEHDGRSSLGSLEGSKWEAGLSSERRNLRGKGLSSGDSEAFQGHVDGIGYEARSFSASRPTFGVLTSMDSVSRLQTVRREFSTEEGAKKEQQKQTGVRGRDQPVRAEVQG